MVLEWVINGTHRRALRCEGHRAADGHYGSACAVQRRREGRTRGALWRARQCHDGRSRPRLARSEAASDPRGAGRSRDDRSRRATRRRTSRSRRRRSRTLENKKEEAFTPSSTTTSSRTASSTWTSKGKEGAKKFYKSFTTPSRTEIRGPRRSQSVTTRRRVDVEGDAQGALGRPGDEESPSRSPRRHLQDQGRQGRARVEYQNSLEMQQQLGLSA